jgi:hypothetical protein
VLILDLNPEGQKITHKKRNFMFSNAGCSLLWAGGYCLSLDVLHGGLGINVSQFRYRKILARKILLGHQIPGIEQCGSTKLVLTK